MQVHTCNIHCKYIVLTIVCYFAINYHAALVPTYPAFLLFRPSSCIPVHLLVYIKAMQNLKALLQLQLSCFPEVQLRLWDGQVLN